MAKYKIYSKAGCIFCDAAMELCKKKKLIEKIKYVYCDHPSLKGNIKISYNY